MGCYKRKLKKGAKWYYSGMCLRQKYNSLAIYKTKRECKKAEATKIKEMEEEAINPKIDIKLLDLFNHRLDNLELTRNAEYFRDNKRLCQKMLAAWGNINVTEVSKIMVSDLIMAEAKRCKKEKLTNSRPNKLLIAAKASFNYAINHFDVDMKNPCAGFSKLPVEQRIVSVPTEEMITAVKAKCNPDQQLLLQFVYDTACRINEATALDYQDVQDEYVVLYTRKSRNSVRTPRMVPRPEYIKPGGKGKVFKEHDAYPRFIETTVSKLKQQPRWNWHGLRRRRASIWAHDDMPLFQIMMLLGHSNISTTQRYLFSLGIIKM